MLQRHASGLQLVVVAVRAVLADGGLREASVCRDNPDRQRIEAAARRFPITAFQSISYCVVCCWPNSCYCPDLARLAFGADLKLLEAVQKRDQKAVLALIKSGADVNAARDDGSTPLAWAASRDDAEIVAALLAAGANVNAADENGETPLLLACGNGNLAIARMLLDAKANLKRHALERRHSVC